MRLAWRLARKGTGRTSPNPAVGAVLVRRGKVIGQGWHRGAGWPHAEIEALKDAAARRNSLTGATLYVTLEPCCTHGRTPPCTDALRAAGIRRVVVAATDPNPAHAGRGFQILRRAGIEVTTGVLASEATRLNEAFNHWILHGTPWVTVKAAMTLDGKIATPRGESKWITSAPARVHAMKLRRSADAILVGINTILADNPSLTARSASGRPSKPLRRVVLDTSARTPRDANVVRDHSAGATLLVVGRNAPKQRVARLSQQVEVWRAPLRAGRIQLPWLLKQLGQAGVTHLLVEGGGEVNAAFLEAGLAQQVVFYYAPMVLGGREARRAVAGRGARHRGELLPLEAVEWRRLGPDLMLSGRMRRT